MKTNEILEGNILIAEFMDMRVNENNIVINQHGGKLFASALQYHFSWNALMPVIFKCHDKGLHFDSQFTQCELRAYCDGNEKLFYDFCNDYPDVIQMVWMAVIKFIKFYNLNKKSES